MEIAAKPQSPETLFYGCADRKYDDFAPLHAASVLSHVQNARVEIGVEDARAYRADHGAATDIIHSVFGLDRFIIREVGWTINGKRIVPNSVRFITTPLTFTEYVYIGDIDIIVLDPKIIDHHLRVMAETGLPYSNRARGAPRAQLSGLHFTRHDAYYPLPNLSDIDITEEVDEALLYKIVQRRGLPIQDKVARPFPGIHVSPNRPPEGKELADGKRGPGWGIRKWPTEFTAFSKSDLMQKLRPRLSPRIQGLLDTVAQYCESDSVKLSGRYYSSKRLQSTA